MENEKKINAQDMKFRRHLLQRLHEIKAAEEKDSSAVSMIKNSQNTKNILDAMAQNNMLMMHTGSRDWEQIQHYETAEWSNLGQANFLVRLQPGDKPFLVSTDRNGRLVEVTDKPVTEDQLIAKTEDLQKPKSPGFWTTVGNAFGVQSSVDRYADYEQEKMEYEEGRYFALTHAGFTPAKPKSIVEREEADRRRAEREAQERQAAEQEQQAAEQEQQAQQEVEIELQQLEQQLKAEEPENVQEKEPLVEDPNGEELHVEKPNVEEAVEPEENKEIANNNNVPGSDQQAGGNQDGHAGSENPDADKIQNNEQQLQQQPAQEQPAGGEPAGEEQAPENQEEQPAQEQPQQAQPGAENPAVLGPELPQIHKEAAEPEAPQNAENAPEKIEPAAPQNQAPQNPAAPQNQAPQNPAAPQNAGSAKERPAAPSAPISSHELKKREELIQRLAAIRKAEADPNFRGDPRANKKEVKSILNVMAQKNMLTMQKDNNTWEQLKNFDGTVALTQPKTYFMAKTQPDGEPYVLSLDITGKLLNADTKPATKDEFVAMTSGLKKPKDPGFWARVGNALGFQNSEEAVAEYNRSKLEYDYGKYYALTNAGIQAAKPKEMLAEEERERQRIAQEREFDLEDRVDNWMNKLDDQLEARIARQAAKDPQPVQPQAEQQVAQPQPAQPEAEQPAEQEQVFEIKEETVIRPDLPEIKTVTIPQAGPKPEQEEPKPAQEPQAEQPQANNGLIVANTFMDEELVNFGPQGGENIEEAAAVPQEGEKAIPAGLQGGEQVPVMPPAGEMIRPAGPQGGEGLERPLSTEKMRYLSGRALVMEGVRALNRNEEVVSPLEHEQALTILTEKGYVRDINGRPIRDPATIGNQTFVIQEPGKNNGCVCFRAPDTAGQPRYCATSFLNKSEFKKVDMINRPAVPDTPLSKDEFRNCLDVMETNKVNSAMKDVALNRLQKGGYVQTLSNRTLESNEAINSDRPYMIKEPGKEGGVLFTRTGRVNCMSGPMSLRTYEKAVASTIAKPPQPGFFTRAANSINKFFGGRGLKSCRDYERAQTMYRRKVYNAASRAGYNVKKPRDVENWERTLLAAAYMAATARVYYPNVRHPLFKKWGESKDFKNFCKSPAAKEFLAKAHRMTEELGAVDMRKFITQDGKLLAQVKAAMDSGKSAKQWAREEEQMQANRKAEQALQKAAAAKQKASQEKLKEAQDLEKNRLDKLMEDLKKQKEELDKVKADLQKQKDDLQKQKDDFEKQKNDQNKQKEEQAKQEEQRKQEEKAKEQREQEEKEKEQKAQEEKEKEQKEREEKEKERRERERKEREQEDKKFVPENEDDKKPQTPDERRQHGREMRRRLQEQAKEAAIKNALDVLDSNLPDKADDDFVNRMETMMKEADGPMMANVIKNLKPDNMAHLRDEWKKNPTKVEKDIKQMEHPEKVLMNNLNKQVQKQNTWQIEQGPKF